MQNTFRLHPDRACRSAAAATPRPHIDGTQTAVVVGPAGEEIFTDKYGRVKVQFHWDRDGQEGRRTARAGCASAPLWAGKQWGTIHIPRIGQEVIVAFEEGDPDQPIIVGSVYNAEQHAAVHAARQQDAERHQDAQHARRAPPTTSTSCASRTRRTSEEIYFHAEKDFNRVVENNDTLKVGFDKKDKGDQTMKIFNNQSLTIGAGKTDAEDGSQTTSIFNNQTFTVGSGKGDNADGSQTISV